MSLTQQLLSFRCNLLFIPVCFQLVIIKIDWVADDDLRILCRSIDQRPKSLSATPSVGSSQIGLKCGFADLREGRGLELYFGQSK